MVTTRMHAMTEGEIRECLYVDYGFSINMSPVCMVLTPALESIQNLQLK